LQALQLTFSKNHRVCAIVFAILKVPALLIALTFLSKSRNPSSALCDQRTNFFPNLFFLLSNSGGVIGSFASSFSPPFLLALPSSAGMEHTVSEKENKISAKIDVSSATLCNSPLAYAIVPAQPRSARLTFVNSLTRATPAATPPNMARPSASRDRAARFYPRWTRVNLARLRFWPIR
jgi:hypothetical protein